MKFVLKKIKNHFVHTRNRKVRDTDVNIYTTKYIEQFYPKDIQYKLH